MKLSDYDKSWDELTRSDLVGLFAQDKAGFMQDSIYHFAYNSEMQMEH
jgi:hypothetical protein